MTPRLPAPVVRAQPKCIDTFFDFTWDAQWKDPDKYSPALKNYHQTLCTS